MLKLESKTTPVASVHNTEFRNDDDDDDDDMMSART